MTVKLSTKPHRVYYEGHGSWNKKRARVHPNLNPSEDLAYLLGVLKGDGCVSKDNQILLHQKRRSFALSFQKALRKIDLRASRWLAKQRYKGAIKRYWRVKAHSLEFAIWYRGLSFEGIEDLFGENRKYRLAFIRGFYESEGCNYQHKSLWRLQIANKNKSLLLFMKRTLLKLGYMFSDPVVAVRGRKYRRPSGKFCTTMYELRSSSVQRNAAFLKEVRPCCKARLYSRLIEKQKRRSTAKIKERKRIASLYRQGLSSIQIARQIGKSKRSVLQALHKENVLMRRPHPILEQAERRRIIELYRKGYTSPQIAKRIEEVGTGSGSAGFEPAHVDRR